MEHTRNYHSLYTTKKHQPAKRLMLLVLKYISLVCIAAGIFFGVRYAQNLAAARREQQNIIQQNGAQSAQSLRVTAPADHQPSAIDIPSLAIHAPIVPLGLNGDGSIMVPAKDTDVGWYQYGPAPGQTGASVLVGHLDSATGTSIFWNLKKIQPGDTISITKKDGTAVNFMIDSLEEYSQNNFPTERVYGATSNAALRLITCAGTWDSSAHRYTKNLVVYATMKD